MLRRNGSTKRLLRIARGERKGVKEERGGESGRGRQRRQGSDVEIEREKNKERHREGMGVEMPRNVYQCEDVL